MKHDRDNVSSTEKMPQNSILDPSVLLKIKTNELRALKNVIADCLESDYAEARRVAFQMWKITERYDDIQKKLQALYTSNKGDEAQSKNGLQGEDRTAVWEQLCARIYNNYEEMESSWHDDFDIYEAVDNAEWIAAVKIMAEHFRPCVSDDAARQLLSVQNPLEALADMWLSQEEGKLLDLPDLINNAIDKDFLKDYEEYKPELDDNTYMESEPVSTKENVAVENAQVHDDKKPKKSKNKSVER